MYIYLSIYLSIYIYLTYTYRVPGARVSRLTTTSEALLSETQSVCSSAASAYGKKKQPDQ